jgi:CsoR family transcriptional regulator, copper-sensing transcriptional repressor
MAKKDKRKDKEKKNKKEGEIRGDFRDEVKRMNRIIGQIEGVCKMLKEGRKLDDVLIQCKAIHSALRSIESRVVKIHLEAALDEIANAGKKKNKAEKISELEELFKFAA